MRGRCPRFAEALDDFYLLQTMPHVLDWHAQPDGWKFCMRIFAAEFQRIQAMRGEKANYMLELLIKKGVM